MSLRPIAALVLLAAACGPAAETAGFVYRLGVDTLAVSSITWTGNRVEGVYVNRVPETSVTRWNATTNVRSEVSRLERVQSRGDSVIERVVVTLAGDSATIERTRGDSVTTRRIAASAGALPRHQSSDPGLLELRTRHAVATGASETIFNTFAAGDSTADQDTLRVVARDTVTFAGGRFRIDSAGRLLTYGGNAERSSLDIEALVASFAARPLGELSPRDSVTAAVGTATVSIAYGRPKKRGREIFGALVPWDRVWRTGAGDATFLTTDREITIGTTRVAAGRYALFTIPGQSGWTLIVSRNIGENAAAYDSTADVARIPMASATGAERVDQFTIVVEPAGLLRMTWDRTTASVPVRARYLNTL